MPNRRLLQRSSHYEPIHRSLVDKHMQEKIFESAASQPEGTPFTLTHALKVAESFEMGKVSQQLVNNGGSEGQLSRISQHQQNKRAVRQPQKSNNNSIKDNNKCGNCGKTGHSSKLNDRRLNCPAIDKVCGKCKTNGHFSDQCRGGQGINVRNCSKKTRVK